MKIPTSLSLFAGLTAAQSVIEGSSFGYGQTLSTARDTIPGWQIGGEGHSPQVLSNKLILTPPYPGNTRGFAWSQTPVSQSEWTAEFQFRATGVERGGGNLQLWYAEDGQSRIGTSSIYTVGQFDGFALVIDMHAGRGGSVRGFLNDGTTDYKSHRSVDSLAFGHCDYSYRNLGRASVVRIKHTNAVFEVTVDDKPCFSTNKVSLPAGNTFGVTAATPENPDSFEIFKLILRTAQSGTAPVQQQQQQHQQQPVAAQNRGAPPPQQQARSNQQPTNEQFNDLSARIESITKAIGNHDQQNENRHLDLQQKLSTKEQVANLDARLQKMEQILQTIQRDLEGKDYRDRFNQLQETLRSSHLSLTEHLQGSVLSAITASTPRMGFFIFLIIAFQVFLAVSYIVYKRRRANMPKKFL
ncbi:concanavalin A-like lectin/glucanase domain-containing protein [Aspergillus leporis]|uniref:Concanavalin A-like lectin/glucanase domain-containing protein n=1 Tax=Aspergillus leporis TaxID=41062 RepID=A0A5N5X8F6_9EURO|nr:concanavalin A-like lectin/glucanase domain-containing protein [Aspergillus leporis]